MSKNDLTEDEVFDIEHLITGAVDDVLDACSQRNADDLGVSMVGLAMAVAAALDQLAKAHVS